MRTLSKTSLLPVKPSFLFCSLQRNALGVIKLQNPEVYQEQLCHQQSMGDLQQNAHIIVD